MFSALLTFIRRFVDGNMATHSLIPQPHDLIDHTLAITVRNSTIIFKNKGLNPIKNITITGREMYKFFGFSAFGLDDTHAPVSSIDGIPIHIESVGPESEVIVDSKMWFSLDRYTGPKQFLIGATFTVTEQAWPSSTRYVPVDVILQLGIS